MKVKELAEACGFQTVVSADPDREVRGCYIGDLLSWVMGRAAPDQLWITIMTNVNTVAVGALADVSAVLLTEGVKLDPAVADCAEARGVNILSTALSSYEAALLVQNRV